MSDRVEMISEIGEHPGRSLGERHAFALIGMAAGAGVGMVVATALAEAPLKIGDSATLAQFQAAARLADPRLGGSMLLGGALGLLLGIGLDRVASRRRRLPRWPRWALLAIVAFSGSAAALIYPDTCSFYRRIDLVGPAPIYRCIEMGHFRTDPAMIGTTTLLAAGVLALATSPRGGFTGTWSYMTGSGAHPQRPAQAPAHHQPRSRRHAILALVLALSWPLLAAGVVIFIWGVQGFSGTPTPLQLLELAGVVAVDGFAIALASSALRRINRSEGALRGRGAALVALSVGLLWIIPGALALTVWVIAPPFGG